MNFTVTFSEPVSGVDLTDFIASTTGTFSGVSISGISGFGTIYTVTVNTGIGSGTLRLDVADNDTILDLGANPLGGSGLFYGDYAAGEAYDVSIYKIWLPLLAK